MTTKAEQATENKGLVAEASVSINTSASEVWDALITPEIVKQYMFGTEVVSDWEQGGPIMWKGIWEGKPYEDKGTILQIEPGRLLQYSHYSPTSGLPDKPGNYHTVTYRLSADDDQTKVTLSQDNNADEKAVEHSRKMWQNMLDALKIVMES